MKPGHASRRPRQAAVRTMDHRGVHSPTIQRGQCHGTRGRDRQSPTTALPEQMLDGLQTWLTTSHHDAGPGVGELDHLAAFHHPIGHIPPISTDSCRRRDHPVPHPAQTHGHTFTGYRPRDDVHRFRRRAEQLLYIDPEGCGKCQRGIDSRQVPTHLHGADHLSADTRSHRQLALGQPRGLAQRTQPGNRHAGNRHACKLAVLPVFCHPSSLSPQEPFTAAAPLPTKPPV
jgi:hypothetical protein